MKLTDFLTKNGKSPSRFAEDMGVPPSTITRILSGDRNPGLPLMLKILEASGGVVTPNDFIPDPPSEE